MTQPADTPPRWGRYAVRGLFGASVLALVTAIILLLTRKPADEAFRWFGQLGFPDVKGRQFVRVSTGDWFQSGNEAPTNDSIDAFLLSESNGSFVVLTKDLFVRSFTNTPPTTPAHRQVGYKTLDLAAEAETYLRLLRNPPKDNWRRFSQRLAERGEVFVMAWACDRNNRAGIALELFDQAVSMCESVPPKTNWWGGVRERLDRLLNRSKLPMLQQLERDLGHAMMWRTIESFGDPAVSRKELLQRLQAIIRDYPASEHVQRAEDTSALLQRMIQEDAAHVSPERAVLSSMPTNQQVVEWIFQLRDQNGQQLGQPGWCDIFMDYRGTTNTPAHELVRIGYPAVPQLIAAIDDRTLTRSVGYHRDFYFSHTVLTVGDCAIAILQRITGKSFYRPSTTSSYPSNDGRTSPRRKAAEQWWAEFQAKGEKQSLIDAVGSGGNDAPAQAQLLLERFPSDALPAFIRGAQAAGEWTRTRLVELAVTLNDPGVTNFLTEEMQTAPALATRVAAAYALRTKGERSSVTAMLKEWERVTESPFDDRSGENLIAFLARADSPEAIAALGRDVRKRKVQTRLQIVESLGRGSWPLPEKDKKTSAETLAAIETELVKALDDLEQRTGMSGSWGDKHFADPRVCDFAGHFLATLWPDRYVFDLSAQFEIRERQRIECQNVWRRAHGLEQLVSPASP